MAERGPKIAFISGPANAREIYREWSQGAQQAYFGTDYMKQFLQVASNVGARSHVVTWYRDKRETFRLGDFTFDNRPIPTSSGLLYYLQQLVWNVRVLFKLAAFRPDVLLLTGNQNFWWLLSPIRLRRPKIIVSYHAVLWPKFAPVSSAWRLMVRLNAWLMLKHARAILVTSADIRRQVEKVLGASVERIEILNHLPTYTLEQFAGLEQPELDRARPFRLIFVGRIVANKGVYDIVELARRLHKARAGEFQFDICGEGEELASVRSEIKRLRLDYLVICHGFCDASQLRGVFALSHASIVPTRTDCEAGFEMTCAEAVLAGRPLIASAVCPALELLADAAMEAVPDDVDSYLDAILKLRDDRELYERKRKACLGLQEQFFDQRNSWYAALMQALNHHALPESSDAAEAPPREPEVAAD